MRKKKILVVDDDKLIRWSLNQKLTEWNYEVFEAENGKSGLQLAEEEMPDLVMLDVKLPDKKGTDLLEEFKKTYGKGISKTNSAWNKSFEGQGIKTVIRRLLTRTAIAKESSVDEMNKFDEMTAEAKPEPTAPPTDIKDRFEAATEETASQAASQEQPKKDDLPLAGKSSTADKGEKPVQKTPPFSGEPVAPTTTDGSPTPEEPTDTTDASQKEMDIF